MTTKLRRSSDAEREALALLDASRSDHDPTALERLTVRRALADRLMPTQDLAVSGEHRAVAQFAMPAKLWIVAACVSLVAAGVLVTTLPMARRAPEAPQSSAAVGTQPEPEAPPPARLATQPSATTSSGFESSETARASALPRLSAATPSPSKAARRARRRPGVDATQSGAESPSTREEPAASESAPQTRAAAPGPAPGPGVAIAATKPLANESATHATPTAPSAADRRDPAHAVTELAWMQQIEAALRGGKPRLVLALSAEHERRWPRGLFALEREGVRAVAACQLRVPDALQRARAFLSDHAQSALAPRVRAECSLGATTLSDDAKPGN